MKKVLFIIFAAILFTAQSSVNKAKAAECFDNISNGCASQGGALYYGGGDVSVGLIDNNAASESWLYLFEPTNPDYLYILSNRQTAEGNFIDITSHIRNAGIKQGDQLIFGIRAFNDAVCNVNGLNWSTVTYPQTITNNYPPIPFYNNSYTMTAWYDLAPCSRACWGVWRMGPESLNYDGSYHSAFRTIMRGSNLNIFQVGFEDLWSSSGMPAGCNAPAGSQVANTDDNPNEFDDLVFEFRGSVSETPNPTPPDPIEVNDPSYRIEITDKTWSFSPSTGFTEKNPASKPPTSNGHDMVWDENKHKAMIFGGNLNYTKSQWTYNISTNNWQQLDPYNIPSRRTWMTMAYDNANDYTWMYGGTLLDPYGYTNELHYYDANYVLNSADGEWDPGQIPINNFIDLKPELTPGCNDITVKFDSSQGAPDGSTYSIKFRREDNNQDYYVFKDTDNKFKLGGTKTFLTKEQWNVTGTLPIVEFIVEGLQQDQTFFVSINYNDGSEHDYSEEASTTVQCETHGANQNVVLTKANCHDLTVQFDKTGFENNTSYAIKFTADGIDRYVQYGGTLGTTEYYSSGWGTAIVNGVVYGQVKVTGLTKNKSYTVSVYTRINGAVDDYYYPATGSTTNDCTYEGCSIDVIDGYSGPTYVGTVYPTTWPAGSLVCVYASYETNPPVNNVTIGEDTLVKFFTDKKVKFTGLQADGTNGKIWFTSAKDDKGGDTNGDGSATVGQPGQWEGMMFGGKANSLNNVTIQFSTDAIYLGQNTGVTLQNSTIKSNSGDAIKMNFDNGIISGSGQCNKTTNPPEILFSGTNTVADNGLDAIDMYTSCYHVCENSRNFSRRCNPGGGHLGPFELQLDGNMNIYNDIPYYIANPLNVTTGTLAIEEGSILKFADDLQGGGWTAYGTPNGAMSVKSTLNVNGTAEKPIHFTSIRDHSVGGKIFKDSYTFTSFPITIVYTTYPAATYQEQLGAEYVKTGPDTWANVQAQCQALGGNLTSINSIEENVRVTNVLRGDYDNINHGWSGWIGYNDIASEGQFAWIDGSTGTFSPWDDGQPNNSAGVDDCVQIPSDAYTDSNGGGYWTSYYGQWNDSNCSNVLPGACKILGSAPAVKDWEKVEITGPDVIFNINYLEISYADTGLEITNTGYDREGNTISNLTIKNSYTGISSSLSNFSVGNSTIEENHDGIYLKQSKIRLSDSAISNNSGDAIQMDYSAGQALALCNSNTTPPDVQFSGNNTISNNGLDGLKVYSSCSHFAGYCQSPISKYAASHESILATNQRWSDDFIYYIANPFIVESGSTLALDAGTNIKFADSAQTWMYISGDSCTFSYTTAKNGQMYILGNLQVNGTETDKISLTSINDESIGGSFYQEDNLYNLEVIYPTSNWSNARSLCQAKGGDLISLHDIDDLNQIKGLFGRADAWIGLSGNAPTNTWSWLDGTTFDQDTIPWESGYPYKNSSYNCGRISAYESGSTWYYGIKNDSCWDGGFPAICKIPKTRTIPQEKDWNNIEINGGTINANYLKTEYANTGIYMHDQGYTSSGSSLNNFIANYNHTALDAVRTNLEMKNSLIENNHDGIHVQQSKISYENGIIRNNVGDAIQLDYNAGQPVYQTSDELCYSNTTPPDVQFSGTNTFTNNGLDGLKVYSSCSSRRLTNTGWVCGGEPIAKYVSSHESILGANQQWYDDAPYYIAHPFVVETGNTLLLNPGTTIKLATNMQYWGNGCNGSTYYLSQFTKNGQIHVLGDLQVNGSNNQKVTATSVNDESVGGSFYQENNLYEYLRITKPTTWSNARSICQSMGGDLASIHDTNDLNMIKGQGGTDFWIGLTGTRSLNDWSWSDGTPFDYAPWNTKDYGYSSNSNNCGVIATGLFNSQTQYLYYLANRACWESRIAICKIPKTRTAPDYNDAAGIEIKGTSSSFDINSMEIKYSDKGLYVHDQGYNNTIGSRLNNFTAKNNNNGAYAYQTAFDIYNSVFDGNQDGLYVLQSKINSSGNTWQNNLGDSIKLDFSVGWSEQNQGDHRDMCLNTSIPPEVNFSDSNTFSNNGLDGIKVFSSCMSEERYEWYGNTPFGWPYDGNESDIRNGYLYVSRYESRVDANTHWYNTAPYYISNPYIQASGTLTLDPGTTIKMSAGTQDWWNLLVNSPKIMHEKEGQMMILGNLESNGSVSNPVTFTSIRDDNPGGHTDSTMSYLFKSSATQNWSNSNAACQAMGGELASIRSIDEQIEAQKLCGPNSSCWIGLTYDQTLFKWYWLNGDDTTYSNWSSQSTSSGECTSVNTRYSGWYSDSCSGGKYAICRRSTGIEFNSSGPQKEDWGDIQIGRKFDVGNGQTNIKYTNFRYGGGGDANAPDDHLLSFYAASANTSEVANSNFNYTNRGILVHDSGVNIHNNSIMSSSDYGVVFDNPLGSNTIFENNTIADFDYGIWLKNITTGLTLRKNNITANIAGALGTNITTNGVTLRNNTIDGGSYYIHNQSTPYQVGAGGTTIDAYSNKWAAYPVTDYPSGKMYKNPGNILYGNYNVTLASPNGTNSWLSKSTHNITWDTDNGGGNSRYADLYYSQDNGSNWTLIVANIDHQGGNILHGDYSWTLPQLTASTVLIKIDLKDIGNTILATDTNSFSAAAGQAVLVDEISDPNPSANVKHTMSYTNALPYTISNGSLKLTMNNFDLSALADNDITITGGGVIWSNTKVVNNTAKTVLFTFTGSINNESEKINIVLGTGSNLVGNPSSPGSYPIKGEMYTNQAGSGTAIDTGTTNLTIRGSGDLAIDAFIPSFLEVTILGVENDQTVNGTYTTESTAPSSIDFGIINPGENGIAAQKLIVSTNASGGYQVDVKHTQPLTGAQTSINDFDGTNENPTTWNTPANNGYFGMTTTNNKLRNGNYAMDRFVSNGGNKWAGLSNIYQIIAASNGPVENDETKVGYRLQVSATFIYDGVYATELEYIVTGRY